MFHYKHEVERSSHLWVLRVLGNASEGDAVIKTPKMSKVSNVEIFIYCVFSLVDYCEGRESGVAVITTTNIS